MNLKIASAATAVAGLTAAGAVFGTSSAQEATPGVERLELRMAYREARVAFVDNPPRMTKRHRSESPGDTAISRGVLRDAAGARAGTLHSIFTITGGKSPRTTELSTGSFVLDDGQISGQGVVSNVPTRGPDRDVLPITGGTGRYEGARGTLEATTGRRGVTFVFNLRR